jgi:hypothetical protein
LNPDSPLDESRARILARWAPVWLIVLVADLLWGAGCQQSTPARAAFRPQIDDPIRGLDDIQVMFDHEQCVAVLGEALQDLK